MQQYRLTKKKKKKTRVTNRPQSRNFQAKHDSSSIPLSLPFRFPFLIQLSSRVLRIGACSLGHRQSGNLKYIFEQNLFLIPCIGGLERLNTVRQNRQRESYLNSLRYRNVEERRKEKIQKYERNLLFFFLTRFETLISNVV